VLGAAHQLIVNSRRAPVIARRGDARASWKGRASALLVLLSAVALFAAPIRQQTLGDGAAVSWNNVPSMQASTWLASPSSEHHSVEAPQHRRTTTLFGASLAARPYQSPASAISARSVALVADAAVTAGMAVRGYDATAPPQM
jgi:hypothetical protein